MTTPIARLTDLGQSLWYDNIQRRLLENGELAAMVERGDIRGVTSNPSIFHNAIVNTHDYDAALVPLAWSGWEAEQIFWQLAIEDIRDACDLFSVLYREAEGADGYVSLEVSPTLAHHTDGTLAQAIQLWEWVDRPNLMVKIPATLEGLPAIRSAIAAGINVNVTLIFSIERYRDVMEAYISGLEDRLAAGQPVDNIASVASFFVSRMDTKVDKLLPAGSDLRGKTAIAYTRLAYEEFGKIFNGERFARCRAAGSRPQRPLWASTSTKDPAYPDTLYVDSLIGPATVNTVPPVTLDAFRDHGKPAVTLTAALDEARQTIANVESLGINMKTVTAELETEGVRSFANAFIDLLKAIDDRRSAAVSDLGPLSGGVPRRVSRLIGDSAPARLWSHDPTLWTSDLPGQYEIRNRLGWLDLPRTSRADLKEIKDFAASVRADGLTHTLLLGMGGSSLAPEVFALVAGETVNFLILDSTDPGQVLETASRFPPEKTLYVVSSKSGDTAEVMAMFAYFWEQAGQDGSHFVAITDPGTTLEALANARGFRKAFLADPTVGGRFSALSHFGLVPAALLGLDIDRLLDRGEWMMRQSAAKVTGARNPGLVLGAVLGEAVASGRDKLTLLADPSVAPLGGWLEQLITESSGKHGKGIVVVDGEQVTGPEGYGADRLFVYLRQIGSLDAEITALREAEQPVLQFDIPDVYALASEAYRWEVATAFACIELGVNAFNQPDVQDNKTRTVDKMTAYNQSGALAEPEPLWESGGIKAFTNTSLNGTGSLSDLKTFLGLAGKGDYVAINAYLPRNPEMHAALNELRLKVREQTRCATTLGFGPRFLHSTGQLHKGGPASGLFVQITADPVEDVKIPGQKATFGVLERAQALGDFEALAARGRRILRLHLPSPEAVKDLILALS